MSRLVIEGRRSGNSITGEGFIFTNIYPGAVLENEGDGFYRNSSAYARMCEEMARKMARRTGPPESIKIEKVRRYGNQAKISLKY